MKNGIISENIYNRSVKRIINKYNKDLKGTDDLADCAFLCEKGFMLGKEKSFWNLDIYAGISNLVTEAAVAGKPAFLQADIVLTKDDTEEDIRDIITILVNEASKYDFAIAKVNVSVSEYVLLTRINVVLAGKRSIPLKPERISVNNISKDNKQIYMLGYAGELGSIYFANRCSEELRKQFSKSYVRKMTEFSYINWQDSLIDISREDNFFIPAGEGGIYSALWKLGEELNTGFEINLRKIAVRQCDIELCNFFNIDIYKLFSPNMMLIVTENPDSLLQNFEEMNIAVTHIGFLTEDNDRKIINRDETRFLNKPDQEEIWKLENRFYQQ